MLPDGGVLLRCWLFSEAIDTLRPVWFLTEAVREPGMRSFSVMIAQVQPSSA